MITNKIKEVEVTVCDLCGEDIDSDKFFCYRDSEALGKKDILTYKDNTSFIIKLRRKFMKGTKKQPKSYEEIEESTKEFHYHGDCLIDSFEKVKEQHATQL